MHPRKALPVALHVSAWVEISFVPHYSILSESHSTWVRELKCCNTQRGNRYNHSRTPRECVSWNLTGKKSSGMEMRRTPRECVSWNSFVGVRAYESKVALHVSAWVEMARKRMKRKRERVALHVSAWVEMFIIQFFWYIYAVALHVSAWVEISMSVPIIC